MKIHKKMLVAGLMLIMLLAISGCGRKNIKIALYQYTENEDGTLTITALTDKGRSEDELVVPAVLDGKSVSTIGDGAFRDDTMIKKVTIEQGITYISSNAFLSCYNLEEIVIPESVEDIGTHAFTETRWRAEKLKDSNDIIVNNILYEADQNKENYSIKDGVVTIASGVFYNNTNLKSVTIPSSVKNIGTYAFSGCTKLTEVILPDGLENIGYAAFMSSGIKEITVPKSVKNIGQDAFLNIKVNK